MVHVSLNVIYFHRNDRKSMPSAYGILETRAQKQVIALFNGSAEGVNDTNMEKHFKDSFALRTQMIQLDPHVDYVVQKFPVLQIVDYVSSIRQNLQLQHVFVVCETLCSV